MIRKTGFAPQATWLYLAAGIVLIGAYDHFYTGPYYLAVGVYSVAGILIGSFMTKPVRRLPWLLLAGGTALWVLGDFVWFLPGTDGPASYPSAADVTYLLGYPLIGVALAILLRERAEERALVVVDAAMITIGIGSLVWIMGFATAFTGESAASVTVSALYLVLDLLLVGLLARLLLSGPAHSPASILLSLGLLTLVVSDLASYVVTWDSWLFWTLMDTGWLVSYVAIGAAALHPSMARPVARPARGTEAFSLRHLLVLAAGGLVAPLALLPHIISDRERLVYGPLLGTVLFFFLTLFRMRHLVTSVERANQTLAEQGKALQEAERRYRTLIEETPAVSYVADLRDEILLYVSPQVKDVLGYEPSELIDDPEKWRQAIHPDDLAEVLADLPDVTKTKHDATFRMVAKDGSTVWVSNRVSPRTTDGNQHLWQGIFLDISDRMRVEELEKALAREREAVAKLQALDEMKNVFLQAVSHELRTPLTSIKGLGATLQLHLNDLPTRDIADLVARINANTERLEALLVDLLDVDKLSRGIFVPTRTKVDVGAVVEEAATSLMPSASQRVVVECASVEICTDASKVERIAENLISNAIKHTPPDCSIWIRVEEDQQGALILVEDSGDGIEGDMKEAIFEPFAQWRSELSHAQGLGLGLSLVRQFAELLDGRAWVEDRPGGGAAFKIRLPADSQVPAHSGSSQKA